MLAIYAAHLGIGAAGAGCAYCGRRMCRHRATAIALSVLLLILESILSVQLVG